MKEILQLDKQMFVSCQFLLLPVGQGHSQCAPSTLILVTIKMPGVQEFESQKER